MNFRNSRDTILGNVAQQGAALLLGIFLPLFLAVEQYGQLTYVATLLSFSAISDFGLSAVYARKMPGVLQLAQAREIDAWNSTAVRFRMYTSTAFGVLIAAMYFLRFREGVNALALALVPPLLTISAQFVSRTTAGADYTAARDMGIASSIARLIVLPGVMLFGLRGWFVAQVLVGMTGLAIRNALKWMWRDWTATARLNWTLVREHLPEAVALGLLTTLWTQLLAAGRLIAAFEYPATVMAQYGLASAAYQAMGSALIAAFIPQTVKVYRMVESDEAGARDYVYESMRKVFPIVMAFVGAATLALPVLLGAIFPKYNVGGTLLSCYCLSLLYYPPIITVGALLVGTRRLREYMALISGGLVLAGFLCHMLEPFVGYAAAALAQLISLSLFAISLILVSTARHTKHSRRAAWPVWAWLMGSNLLSVITLLVTWA